MTKWKAAQASVPVSQRIMVLTDGAASSNILSWWAPNSCDDKVFSVSSHFHNLVSISIRTSSSNNWLLTFLKLFAWSGKAIKSPMDPEMNIKSWLLQRTAAFEVNVLKHVKYTSAVQQKREYFKRILSSTSFLLPSSLKCSVYQTACWVRKVSRVGCYLKVHSAALPLPVTGMRRRTQPWSPHILALLSSDASLQRCPSTFFTVGIRRHLYHSTLLQNCPPWHLPCPGTSAWVCIVDTTPWHHT